MSVSPLDVLADAAGIEPRYWDIQGRVHERSPEVARAILAALGIAAGSDAEIAEGRAALESAPWREIVPPVVFAAEGADIDLPIRLPAATRRAGWTITLEAGGRVGGEFDLAAIPAEARARVDGIEVELRRLKLPAQPLGYHRLRLAANGETEALLCVAPARCHLPSGRKYWGISAQLYALRSVRDRGIGDFGDLGALVEWSAAHGADFVGLNPLHALFLDSPQDASPYSPCSRLFLNPLYLDVAAIPEFAESASARALANSWRAANAVSGARQSGFVDYPAVAHAKLAVLDVVYRQFRTAHRGSGGARDAAYRDFLQRAGRDLDRFAVFQALGETLQTHDWTRWPEPFRSCGSDEVARYAQSREERVSFFRYLQWQCEAQLGAAARTARESGMAIGLYGDMAVSVDAASADRWANRDVFLGDLRVGAPPDPFNEQGQEWGVVPLDPRRLRASGYAHFVALLRANMRHSGALRIDHVMGWQRLFVIPAGAPPSAGVYLRYPLDELLAIAALESRRARCIVIGEDLGTVPAGFRERMAAANVLSCRVLYFERDNGRFRRPAEFPERAAVTAATHDLATLRGYWSASDIDAKAKLGIFKTEADERRARDERARDKALLLEALGDEGLMPQGLAPEGAQDVPWSAEIADALQEYLARTPSLLLAIQLDDLAGELAQANLPGTATEYPNWRRRQSSTLEDIFAAPAIARALDAVARARRSLT